MADLAHEEVDKLIKQLEDKMKVVYGQAVKEMDEKLQKQLADYQKKLNQKKSDYLSGKITGVKFDTWKKNQARIIGNTKDLVSTLTDDFTNCDKIAVDLINGHTPEAYALNYNYATYGIEKGTNINTSFTLYDHRTVENLIVNEPNLLPKPKINIPKDVAWNKKHITSAITQGVLQGESIPKIAARLMTVVGMDDKAAVRNARTAMTGAQNAGRLDSYRRAQGMGIHLAKKWVSVLDGRVRHTHRMLDGETVEIEQKFGNGLMNPGDPQGRPEEVYNCRCRMVSVLRDFPISDEWKYQKNIAGVTYEEWKGKYAYANPKVTANFRNMSMSQVIKTVNNRGGRSEARKFTNLVKTNDVWNKYLTGNLKKENVKKIDDFLAKHTRNTKTNKRDVFSRWGGVSVYSVDISVKAFGHIVKKAAERNMSLEQYWNYYRNGHITDSELSKLLRW